MLFTKVSILAVAGLVAANNANINERDDHPVNIREAQPMITAVPMARSERDLGDVVDDVSTFIDGAKSKAESAFNDASTAIEGAKSKAGSWISDAASHVSTAIDGAETWVSTKAGAAETWVSTKAGAASSAVQSAADAASSAAASASSAANNNNAAPSARDSKAGVVAAVLALGATAFGFMLV